MSVARAAAVVATTWPRAGDASFRALTADCAHTLEVVARFLGLLELYRQQRVTFDQLDAARRAARALDRRVRPAPVDGRRSATGRRGAGDVDEEYR